MARRPRTAFSTSARWLAGVLVSVLAIATIVLVVLAIQNTRPVEPAIDPEPVPTFSFGVGATPTSAPTVSEAPAASAPPQAAEERLLSVGSGRMWRGTAGDCGVTAPLIERSTDGGATWDDVTPTYRGIGGLLSLDAFAQTEAEIVAEMGAGCEIQALRTFTQGEFWEPYPEVLAASRYLDTAATPSVVTPQGAVPAPCAAPRSFRAQGEIVALVCDGVPQRLVDGAWVTLPTQDVAALAATSDSVLTAATAPECTGVQVAEWSGPDFAAASVLGCAEGLDPAAPLALAGDGDAVVLWSADSLTRLG
jgi:hypothetical protein